MRLVASQYLKDFFDELFGDINKYQYYYIINIK